ncbi:hypothetical protein ATCC90586_005773 [Pythium insidiosum]|nr:hypothetical protein ATCC90586_005773 [Pythium insidiosum]
MCSSSGATGQRRPQVDEGLTPASTQATKGSPAPQTRTTQVALLHTVLQALWPCAFYLTCSFAMNMFTKALLTTFDWHAIYTLGAVQNAFTTLSVAAFTAFDAMRHRWQNDKAAAWASPTGGLPRTTLTWRFIVRVVLPLVALNVGNTVLGFAAMRIVNMPMYLVLRRLTTLKVLLLEWLVLRKPLSKSIRVALLVSTFGSLLASSTDVTSAQWGYVLVLLQNVCSAGSLTFSKESGLDSRQLVLLNSSAGAVICGALAWLLEGGPDVVLRHPALQDPAFLALALLMCCTCVLYQFAIMICTLRNSALATSVTGNVKDLLSTVCGFVYFHDVQVRAANVAGVAVSLLGAYTFSYVKYQALARDAASEHSPGDRHELRAAAPVGHIKQS